MLAGQFPTYQCHRVKDTVTGAKRSSVYAVCFRLKSILAIIIIIVVIIIIIINFAKLFRASILRPADCCVLTI